MTSLGEIFRRYGSVYRARFGGTLSASQKQAMQAIAQCRTKTLGGHAYTCPSCQTTRYSYHSCRNRHCPTCQHHATQAWLAEQQALLLPVRYFLLTQNRGCRSTLRAAAVRYGAVWLFIAPNRRQRRAYAPQEAYSAITAQPHRFHIAS